MAQPGDAASATAEAGSGISRVAPAGPSIAGIDVMPAFSGSTENTAYRPDPYLAPSSTRRSGITLTRVTPSGPTTARATASTPAEASRRATVAAVGAVGAVLALERVGAVRLFEEGLRTAPDIRRAPSRSPSRPGATARSAAWWCRP